MMIRDDMIKCNLNKAQKIMDKFKTEKKKNKFSRSEEKTYSCTSKYTFEPYIDDKNIIEDVSKAIKHIRDEFNMKWLLMEDKQKLKNCIFQKNMESGLSNILAEITILTSKKEELKNMIGQYAINAIKQDDLQKTLNNLRNMEENTENNINITLEIFNRQEIEQMLYDISKKINELEEQKDKINCNTIICVELHSETMKFLGL